MIAKEEALRKYPVGTKYIPVYSHGKPMTYKEGEISNGVLSPDYSESDIYWINSQQGFVYYRGVWAEIINEGSKISFNYLIL